MYGVFLMLNLTKTNAKSTYTKKTVRIRVLIGVFNERFCFHIWSCMGWFWEI